MSPTPPRRTYRKGDERRRSIVETALEIFSERGYGSSSMREIASRAGLTQSGLLHHFASKEQLLIEVLELRDQRISERVESSGGGLRARILAIAEHNARHRNLSTVYTILLAESVVLESPAHAYFSHRYTSMLAELEQQVGDEQAAGLLKREARPEAVAAALIALLDSFLVLQELVPDFDPVERLRMLVDELLLP